MILWGGGGEGCTEDFLCIPLMEKKELEKICTIYEPSSQSNMDCSQSNISPLLTLLTNTYAWEIHGNVRSIIVHFHFFSLLRNYISFSQLSFVTS